MNRRLSICSWLAGILLTVPAVVRAQDTVRTLPIADTTIVEVTHPGQMADSVIVIARKYLGVPYRLGAVGPEAYDCSSFVRQVFSEAGYDIPRYTYTQIKAGREIDNVQELQRGDLVFFGQKRGVRDIGHIGIVVDVDVQRSNFTFIHCGVTTGVTVSYYSHPYFLMRYITARRILPDLPEETR